MNKTISSLLFISLIALGFTQAMAHSQPAKIQKTTKNMDEDTRELLQSLIGYSGGGEEMVQDCIKQFKSADARVVSARLESYSDSTSESGIAKHYYIIGKNSSNEELTMKITEAEGGNTCKVTARIIPTTK